MHLLLALALMAASPDVQQTPARAAAAQKAQVVKKVATLIEDARFKYRKAEEGIWVINFKGQNSDSIDVVVEADADMVVVLSTVKKKASPSQAQLRQLLEANYKANYSKLAIDKDGDLLSLIELPTDLTVDALRKAVDEVASLADTAVALILPEAGATGGDAETIDAVPPGRGATLTLLRGAFELSYDPKKWKVAASTDPTTTQLNHVSGDVKLKVIAERVEVAPESLKELALSNAKGVAPEIKVESETWRTVNGLRVLLLRYGGTASGVKFTFYNQMYSDPSGIVQLAGWTASNLFNEYRPDLLELFAGFRKLR